MAVDQKVSKYLRKRGPAVDHHLRAAASHPLDVCACGDYRRNHENGTGACEFNGPRCGDIGHPGNEDCLRFRLSEPAAKDVSSQ